MDGNYRAKKGTKDNVEQCEGKLQDGMSVRLPKIASHPMSGCCLRDTHCIHDWRRKLPEEHESHCTVYNVVWSCQEWVRAECGFDNTFPIAYLRWPARINLAEVMYSVVTA